jgi:hypothetical protein
VVSDGFGPAEALLGKSGFRVLDAVESEVEVIVPAVDAIAEDDVVGEEQREPEGRSIEEAGRTPRLAVDDTSHGRQSSTGARRRKRSTRDPLPTRRSGFTSHLQGAVGETVYSRR